MRHQGFMMQPRTSASRACLLLLLSSVAGCYVGVGELPEIGDETSGDSSGDETGFDDSGDPSSACEIVDAGPTELRRLTSDQYDNTVRDLLGIEDSLTEEFAPDERVASFKSNIVAPDELQVKAYRDAAELAAEIATTKLDQMVTCDPTAVGVETCTRTFVTDFGLRAYRRPLEPNEIDTLTGLALEAEDFESGIRLAISAMLQSPFFIYHVEFGVDEGGPAGMLPLTDYELASRLSYFLWNTMPDDALFAAANAGELSTTEGIRTQVERMLQDVRAEETIESFHLQWLGVDDLEHLEKDPSQYPDYTPALARAMKDDFSAFARYVFRERDGSFDALMTESVTLTNDPELLAFFGVQAPEGHVEGDPISLNKNERRGLITHPAFLAAHSHRDQSSPILRGVTIRTDVLCYDFGPVPADIDNSPPEVEPDSTTRERFAIHTADPTCAGCHAFIDPIGFGLEQFDAIGQFREFENGIAIDASGELTGTRDVNGPFEGGAELASLLGQSEQVGDCATRQWFRYALGRLEDREADACTTEQLSLAFDASGRDLRTLLTSIALSNAFRYRRTDS